MRVASGLSDSPEAFVKLEELLADFAVRIEVDGVILATNDGTILRHKRTGTVWSSLRTARPNDADHKPSK